MGNSSMNSVYTETDRVTSSLDAENITLKSQGK